MKRLFAAALAAVVLPSSAQAAITINIDQVGTSVVLTGSGTFNTTGLSVFGTGYQGSPVITPANGIIALGNAATMTMYNGLTGGPALGTWQPAQLASSTTGDFFGFNRGLGTVYLASAYQSNALLNGTSTYLNSTIASLHLTAGQYFFNTSTDTITVNIGQAVAAVPETATWGMMIAGFALIGGALRSNRRKTAVSFG